MQDPTNILTLLDLILQEAGPGHRARYDSKKKAGVPSKMSQTNSKFDPCSGPTMAPLLLIPQPRMKISITRTFEKDDSYDDDL